MQTLTPDDVQAVLDEHDTRIKIHFFDTTTATSQDAADNIGCALGQIIKSICFIVNKQQPVLVLASGDQQVDERKIAAVYEVGRKKVKTASTDQCIEIFGYAPGGVPPFGHRTPGIPVYIDTTLSRFDTLYAAGGDHNAIFPITLEQVQGITGGTLLDVVRD